MRERVIQDSSVKGDIEIKGKLIFEEKCVVLGNISADTIVAKDSLEVLGNIKATTDFISYRNVRAGGSINAGMDIRVSLLAQADGQIKAGRDLRVGSAISRWSILAGGDLKAKDGAIGENIWAGSDIWSGSYLEAKSGIRARGDIHCDEYAFSFDHRVEAASLSTRTLFFSRSYWAEMPPLKKWRREILYGDLCWDGFRSLATKAEAEEICAWNGWHWLLRAHLEMFFRLRDQVVPPHG